MPQWSNFGSTLDILAPGVNVLTTGRRSKTAIVSGTSFSAPYVAGAAAIYMVANPSANPAAVATGLYTLAASSSNAAITAASRNTVTRSVYVKDIAA
jgi:subtilisin family serine protease